uniref:FMN-dependent alpha-hydroxy acid dehydrogenase n=1 Tax=uncultured bacterium Contig1578 TaxID=1393460 RepID=W0FNZ1_9BACT|nr:FMN-dependent alpha-hydroxy acid dehydrogenase [uncultured bacterium Contig1578]
MSDTGNSNRIARAYLDSLRIETRYMDSVTPTIGFELYGARFSTPIMTAALSHLDHFMFEGAAGALAKGAKAAGAALWYGMADDREIEALAAFGAPMIEIIKPYADREAIYRRIAFAEALGLLAVGIDIDHPFGPDGSPDVVDGEVMAPLQTAELTRICGSTPLPVIVKGVLSVRDAERCLTAGARGLVLSHHNNRVEYALPPVSLLPDIAALMKGRVPLFVDCEIRTGMDAFKALALGATGVCIGRPLMTAIEKGGADGVCDYLNAASAELKKAMACTGCADLAHMDPTVIHGA